MGWIVQIFITSDSPHTPSLLPSYRVFGTYDTLHDNTLYARLDAPFYALLGVAVLELHALFLRSRRRL